MLRRVVIAFTFVVATPSCVLHAAGMTSASRIAILRGLVAESATVLAPLPGGQKGLRIDADAGIDQDSLTHELTQQGTAVPSKTVIQITQIEFRDKEIVFEINGGGKKKDKWYNHVQVGIGGGDQTAPITNPNAKPGPQNGSKITLAFSQKLPDMTVDEVKQQLATVLDFEAKNPILAITSSVPITPEFKQAIEEKRAVEGMSTDMVLAALGPPDRKVREERDGAEEEDWIYGSPPLKTTFVTFEEDKVVEVKEYAGGVRGETYPYPSEPPR